MDKPGKSGRGGGKGTNKSHQLGELIALGSKTGGGSSGSERKREATAPVSSTAPQPPLKKQRILDPSSTTSSHKSSSSSKSSKKASKDPHDVVSSAFNPADLSPDAFYGVLEKASKAGDPGISQGLIIGGFKKLRESKGKEQIAFCHCLILGAKNYGVLFQTNAIVEAAIALINPKKISGDAKAKIIGSSSNPLASIALAILALSHTESSHWPVAFAQMWIEDAATDRLWVDLPYFKEFIENLLVSFGTIVPSSHLLTTGEGGGGIGGPASPLPSSLDELNLHEEIKVILDENPLDMPLQNRFDGQENTIERMIIEFSSELLHKKTPEVPKNLLKSLSFSSGLSGVRGWVVGKLEQWLHNGKTGRNAQELLMYVCVNANCNTNADIEIVSSLSRLKMKTKPLTHVYSQAIKEMVQDNEASLLTVLTQIIYNELSPQRNPNNYSVLGTIFAGVAASRAVVADIFIDLLQKREDYHAALRLLLREIVRSARFECDLTQFVKSLLKPRDITWLGECRERAFIAISDLILLSMFLSLSPQVREASIVATMRAENRDMIILQNFRSLVSEIQLEGITWMFNVVAKMFRPQKVNFTAALHKILLKDPATDLVTKDGWPSESEKSQFTKMCLEVKINESGLVFLLLMGISKEHPVLGSEVIDLAEQWICKAALHKSCLAFQRREIVECLFRLAEYRHPDNIILPEGYEPPKLAITKAYWKVWIIICILAAHNPVNYGQQGWNEYPTLRAFMEMCITNQFQFPTPSSTESKEEIFAREAQIAAMERQEILQFEGYLSTKPIEESNSLLLSQLIKMDPFGLPRTPPASTLAELQNFNEKMFLGHQLCRSRNPDFLLDLIQRNSEPMPWLSRLVTDGSFEMLPVQCLCEFMMGHITTVQKALTLHPSGLNASPRNPDAHDRKHITKVELTKEELKLIQLLHHLQDIVNGSGDETELKEVLEYFLRRLSSPKMQSRSKGIQALQLLLVKPGREDDWLLDCIPSLRPFNDMQASILVLLRQAIQVENEPAWVTNYLEFLSTWAHLADDVETLAMDVSQLVVERNGLLSTMLKQWPKTFESLFDIFLMYMKKIREPHKESYKWSEDSVLIQWKVDGLECSINILIIHAIVVLLSSYTPKSQPRKEVKYNELMDIWFPTNKENTPKGLLLSTSEEAMLYPDWMKLRMIRSDNSRLCEAALDGLEADSLLLFIQHFGIPVKSMSALLLSLDKLVELNEEHVIKSVMNVSYLNTLVQIQWKRGVSGGKKFVDLLKRRCGVPPDPPETKQQVPEQRVPIRPVLNLSSRSPPESSSSRKKMLVPQLSTHNTTDSSANPALFDSRTEDKGIDRLSQELLQLSSPPISRRRSSVPVRVGDETLSGMRRHSSHVPKVKEDLDQEGVESLMGGGRHNLGKLVDTITVLEPTILRNAMEFQLPLLFGRNESMSNCRSFLMTTLTHQAGWDTIQKTLDRLLSKFDSSFDPSSILDLLSATHYNPRLFQGVDKHVPKHQSNFSVLNLSCVQLAVMAEYIIEEITQMEMKSTRFSISNLLGPSTQSQPVTNGKHMKKSLQERVHLWLQCCHQDKTVIDSAIQTVVEIKGKVNPCLKKFLSQVYMDFPEIILVENWQWKMDSWAEDEVTSVLDSISHALITAIATTQGGKEWLKKQAHDYEICLRKLAFLHPALLLRQLPLMGALLKGRVHLESSVFHQQNHNLPFVVYLALFNFMMPHILGHFKTIKPILVLYIKLFKNYGPQKDYSSSLTRFCLLLQNFLNSNPLEVKEFLSPHYATLRELSTIKFYTEVASLHCLIGNLVPPSGHSSVAASTQVSTITNLDIQNQAISSIAERFSHASNHEEIIPVLQELDSVSNRNPEVLSRFSQNLTPLLKSETETCRSLAFTLVLKHLTHCPGGGKTYLESVLKLLNEENSHVREALMERIHEFVLLDQGKGEEILMRLFQLGISCTLNSEASIQKSAALFRNFSSL